MRRKRLGGYDNVSTISRKLDLRYTDEARSIARSRLGKLHAKSKEPYLEAAKRILRCMKGTIEHGIIYKKKKKTRDIDYARDLDMEKVTY